MKKQFYSCVLCLMLLVATMPIAASAQEVQTENVTEKYSTVCVESDSKVTKNVTITNVTDKGGLLDEDESDHVELFVMNQSSLSYYKEYVNLSFWNPFSDYEEPEHIQEVKVDETVTLESGECLVLDASENYGTEGAIDWWSFDWSYDYTESVNETPAPDEKPDENPGQGK